MNKHWLYLRFFDEKNDPPLSQTHVFGGLLLILLHAVIPVGMALSLVMMVRNDQRSALMWAVIAIASSLCVTLVEVVNRRPGHARNQLVLTAALGLLVTFANL